MLWKFGFNILFKHNLSIIVSLPSYLHKVYLFSKFIYAFKKYIHNNYMGGFYSGPKGEFPLIENFLRTGTERKRKASEHARIHQM